MEILRFDDEPTATPKRKKSSRSLLAVTFFAVVLGLGSAFASSSITINSDKGIDLGQGVTLVAACDKSLHVSLVSQLNPSSLPSPGSSDTATPTPHFNLNKVQTSELDATSSGCGGKTLVFQLFDGANNPYDCSNLSIASVYLGSTPISNSKYNCTSSKINITLPDSSSATILETNFNNITYDNSNISAITIVSSS